MPRKIGKPSDVLGSGKEVRLIDDLGSAVVREVVEQLNNSEIILTATLTAGAAATARAMLGRWRNDMFIREISIGNPQIDDFVNAATDIFLRHVTPTNADLVGTPVSPTDLFALEGFATGNFAGPNFAFAEDFVAATNVDAVTGGAKVIVPAGNVFYVEFINAEVGTRSLEVSIIMAPTDKIRLEPRGISDPYFDSVRAFRRQNRVS